MAAFAYCDVLSTAEGGGTIGGGGATAEPHTLLYADPVSVPTLKRVGVTSSLETAPSALYYPNGSKRHTLRLEIQRQLASLSSESSSSSGGAATRLRRAARSGRRRGKSSTGQLSSTFEEKVGRSGRTVRRSPALLRSGYNAAIGQSLHFYGVGSHVSVPDEVGAASRYTSDGDGGPGSLIRGDVCEGAIAMDALDETLMQSIADAVAMDDPLMTPLSASISALHRPQHILASSRLSARRLQQRTGDLSNLAPLDTSAVGVAVSPFGRKISWETRQSLSRSSQRSREAATPRSGAQRHIAGDVALLRSTGACHGVPQCPPSREGVDLEAHALISSLLRSNRRIDRLSLRACAR